MSSRPHLLPLLVALALACARAGGGEVRRVVAIGDLHGDLEAARRALRLAGAIDGRDRWIGGKLVVVQLGDELDRGDDEPQILELFDRLERDAARAGGRVIPLLGNHELMNAAGDLRYVTPDGFKDYGGEDARRHAFAPGSPLARDLARRSIYAVVGDTLFVHGGVRLAHAAKLPAEDEEARAWLRGERPGRPVALLDDQGPLWSRLYGGPEDARACDEARAVLKTLHLGRMVVAHTPQEGGIGAICDGAVWRVDVGLARAYGGPTQVLELGPGGPRVLK